VKYWLRTGFLALAFFVPSFAHAAEPALVPGAALYERSDNEFASAIVVDSTTGKRLYAYKPDLKWTAASLTKLLSTLVAVEHRPSWNAVVALSSKDEVGGGRLRVESGAKMTYSDMFYSTIVGSANNTATALARLSGLGSAGFIKAMNAKAKALGMTNSSFYEVSGMDPKNTVTAKDMLTLATAAFNEPTIRKAASTMTYRFKVQNTGEQKKIVNTNTLLTTDPDVWVTGGKTGFLYESQYNLAVRMKAYPFDASKPQLTIVVLGAPTKDGSFKTAKALANWAWRAYSWK
jgi:D-alanyl-D-alanine endopeptidase (penicillin-binding protein 7)